VWAAAFLAAGWPEPALGLAAAALVGGVVGLERLLRFIPLLGARSVNVVAHKRGRDQDARPLVVVAHLDTHPTGGAPLGPLHLLITVLSGWVALAAGILAQPGATWYRLAAALVAAEAVLTLFALARRELTTPGEPPDDNTSGVLALIRAAELVGEAQPLRDVWIVGSSAGTAGSFGMSSFLRARPALRNAWVVEIDALGTGELVASPFSSRFPYPGTPAALIRAVVAAARESGDPLQVRRVRRAHSDARAALRRIGELGFSPNRTAALGLNLVLLVNLAGAAWLAARFLRGRSTLHRLERWQTAYLPVFALWAAAVVVVLPPLFGFS
jgi:hypothetical protein